MFLLLLQILLTLTDNVAYDRARLCQIYLFTRELNTLGHGLRSIPFVGYTLPLEYK